MVSKAEIVKLREKTGAGIMDCKRALQECGGDLEKAVDFLRKQGLAAAAKKAGRVAKEGAIGSYVHHGGKIGVLVEVNCETDFVARTDEFKKLIKDLAMQIAAQRPLYIRREDVPADVVEKERRVIQEGLQDKPKKEAEKIEADELEKFYKEFCLLEQPFIRDVAISIKDYLTQVVAKLGENIVIRRFQRLQLGEEA